MQQLIFRETWAEINLEAIEYNIKEVKNRLPNGCQVMAVVKANGYGHGDVEVAKRALEAGATFLGVALLEEAVKLRNAGITAPILVMNRVLPKYAPLCSEKNITLMFFQKEWLEEVSQYKYEHELKLHLKLDTGMGRLGLKQNEELKEILSLLKDNKNISITGVYTHFATADEADTSYFDFQYKQFNYFLEKLDNIVSNDLIIHSGNSAAAIRHPEKMQSLIRLGISMYGLYPSNTIKEQTSIQFKQAFSLHSKLVHVKEIQHGEKVGYGIEFEAKENTWIGTIPIGYADGWTRKLKGFHVLVEGKKMPIVGRICMDQTMIQLDQNYPLGTEVTLIGEQQGAMICMDEVAAFIDTINYEIPCMISYRVPRVYT